MSSRPGAGRADVTCVRAGPNPLLRATSRWTRDRSQGNLQPALRRAAFEPFPAAPRYPPRPPVGAARVLPGRSCLARSCAHLAAAYRRQSSSRNMTRSGPFRSALGSRPMNGSPGLRCGRAGGSGGCSLLRRYGSALGLMRGFGVLMDVLAEAATGTTPGAFSVPGCNTEPSGVPSRSSGGATAYRGPGARLPRPRQVPPPP